MASESSQRRIYLTLEPEYRRDLEEWADQQGRPVTNLATFIIQSTIDRAKKSGEFKPRSSAEAEGEQKDESRERAQKFIQAILRHESIDETALAQLASDLEADPKDLSNLLKSHGGEVTNDS